jgi:hypothetical protein
MSGIGTADEGPRWFFVRGGETVGPVSRVEPLREIADQEVVLGEQRQQVLAEQLGTRGRSTGEPASWTADASS